jgi:hypothetical protein
MHSGVPRPVPACASFLPNPLNGGACENNGTMIIDVTDPRNPVEKALIPAPTGGQAQMARMCLGSQLTRDVNNKKVYLMRNVQANNLAISGYQVWDVTDVAHPVKASELTGIRSTHKQWWECDTGITYMPGSLSTGPLVAAVTVDAHLRLEEPHCAAGLHPLVRVARRGADRHRRDTGLAPRSDLGP